MDRKRLISLHGGHSGQYCNHAKNLLEDIIIRYIELGFTKVGITEHVPPVNDQFLYPEEKELNLTTADLHKRFKEYFKNLRYLKQKYETEIKIFVGMETETYKGYVNHIKSLVSTFQPDYIVGSVHHIDDICFDYSKEKYDKAASVCGSYDAMYEKYFDLQYAMIKSLKPFVVGHFDLIRIFDPHYRSRLSKPIIKEKIHRNLEAVKVNNLILDFNMRALRKGAPEPYLSSMILECAMDLKIPVIPGDDSHDLSTVGQYVEQGIGILNRMGFDTDWKNQLEPLSNIHR